MINICGSAGTGKTKELVLMASRENAIIVCENPEKMRLRCHDYGIVGIDCISYYDYIENILNSAQNFKQPDLTNYVIDEIEKFLGYLSPNTLGFTSLTE